LNLRVCSPWIALAALTSTAACTSVLGLKTPTLRWCAQPQNQHDFCEDFDHENYLGDWTLAPDPPTGATRTIVESTDSAPNALSTTMQPLATGAANLTGLATAFSSRSIDHVVVNVDVRVAQAEFMQDGQIASGIGFLLVEDTTSVAGQTSTCIGLVLAPPSTGNTGTVTVALIVVPAITDCFTVNNLMLDGGDATIDVPSPIPLATILTNQWQHITLEVIRGDDGAGIVRPTVANTGALPDVPIPTELFPEGYPQLGIASSVTGPAGNVEIDFDNVAADFP
jgi:hypothetical protein